jgi:exopolyphosphatase/guanosine-5'-triphosphate,3'-diphosphate pyrophosphatase
MRVAVVDIGTNSTRLLIADVETDGEVVELERRTSVTRLGAGVDAGGRLAQDAIARVVATLDEYGELIDGHAAGDRASAVLTSAVRDASNGPEFEAAVARRYRLDARTLTGDEEAQATFRGATNGRDQNADGETLVVDVGGGSTELVTGSAGSVSFHVSTQLGVVRQTERHLRSDPPAAAELEALVMDARETMAAAVPTAVRRSARDCIAVAGTPTSLAAIAQQLEPYDRSRVEGYRLTTDEARAILDRLAALPLAERREVAGLHPDRAPTIVAGAIILLEALRCFDLSSFEVSERDILHGVALEMAQSA